MASKTTSLHNIPPPSPAPEFNSTVVPTSLKMMMHMSFYWGHTAEVLFSGWPGSDPLMYGLALVVVFVLAVLVEWISFSTFIKSDTNGFGAGLLRMGLHTVRTGLSYMVMLAVMSYNGGIFVAAVGGHAVGYVVFGTRAVMKKSGGSGQEKRSDL